MSRTKKVKPKFKVFRAPRSKQEKTLLNQLLTETDIELFNVELSKRNRVNSRFNNLPSSWSDLYITSLESKY